MKPDATTEGTEAGPLRWDKTWNIETARLAYEQARETERLLDATADLLDRKTVAVFGVSAAIVTIDPALARAATYSAAWWFLICAAIVWLLSTFQGWQAFRPRQYVGDPNPGALITRDWLALEPGAYHLARLHRVAATVAQNEQTIAALSSQGECSW